MKRALAAALGWAVLAGASATQACSPPMAAAQTAEEIATEAAQPNFASGVRSMRDIFLARIEQVGPAPISVVPARQREGDIRDWPAEDLPVRYRFTVLQVLKGKPRAQFEYRTRLADAWPAAMPKDEPPPTGRSEAADDPGWWSDAFMSLGESRVRSDCGWLIAFPSGVTHLVYRNAEGEVVAALPVRRDGPLVRAVEAVLADPALDYPHRMSVADYLKASSPLAVVEVENCAERTVRVVERLKQEPGAYAGFTTSGKTYHVSPPWPGACTPGRRFLAAGGQSLHPIRDGVVRFEDRYMQMRFDGPKTLPLAQVRALAAKR